MIYNYNKLTPFKKYIIQNFPYIDADFDGLTNYQLYAQVVDYLNKVIDEMNGANEQVEILTNAFNDLQDYVQDYFDNLDVQNEIDNKLDEMVSTGELQQLVNNIFVNLQTQITALSSGSPAGVYATYSDLTTANPDHSRIYVVTADGNWYYYNTSNATWTSGGTYQSSVNLIDNTLSERNVACDSATVGDTFNEISDLKRNYNLFNYNTITEHARFTEDGTNIEETTNFVLSDFIEVDAETNYITTASGTSTWGRRLTYNNRVKYYDATKTELSFTNIGNYTLPTKMISTPENCKYLRVSFTCTGGTKTNVLNDQIMLIKTTSDTATIDERLPYKIYGFDAKVSKENLTLNLQNDISNLENIVKDMEEDTENYNLLDISKMTLNSVDSISNTPVYYATNRHLSNLIEIKTNKKYIITIKSTANSWGREVAYAYFVYFFDENMNYLSMTDRIQISLPNTLISPPSNAKYMRLSINASNQADIVAREPMILETTTETCFVDERVPYKVYHEKEYKITNENLSKELYNAIYGEIKNTYRYICFTFQGTTQNGMIILGSNDLRTFDLLAEKGIYVASQSNSVRDPAVIKIKDYYYITYTVVGFSSGNTIGMCRTKDFINYEELTPLVVKDSTDETKIFYQVWAPAWFRDTDGKIYIISSTRETSDGTFSATINEYDPSDHSLKSGTVTNINYIDGHIVYDNGYYYMFVGGGRLYKASSLNGTWTQLNNLNYGGYEADFPIKLDNGKWRLYMQQLDASFSSEHMVYINADTIEGTWSSPVLVSYTDDASDYALELDSSGKSEFWHWTIYDMKELNGNNNNIVEL